MGDIGFLGAGSIIQGPGQISGLTTAASVWIAGAIGVACGVGAYAIAVTLLALLTLAMLGLIEHRLSRAKGASDRHPRAEDKN